MTLPDPIIVEHEGIQVVRDDLLPGGTKRRAIHVLFDDQHQEYVYASPVYGYAQLALAYAARDHGKLATIFCAKRKERHPLTREAERAGALVHEVPYGYLSHVTAEARVYSARHGAKLLPFGFNAPVFLGAMVGVAQALPIEPPHEVWTVIGSGTLTRALQRAWPDAVFYGVQIGAEADAGMARICIAPERYEQPSRGLPPFPSCANYDAKAWAFIKRHAASGALFWNVGR